MNEKLEKTLISASYRKPIASSVFLLAIVISLTIHAMILAGMWIWPASYGNTTEELLTELDFIEITEELEKKIPQEMRPEDAEEVRNVESNLEAKRSYEVLNYSSKEKIADDVYRDLKNYEQQVLKELNENKTGIKQPETEVKNYKNTKEMYDQSGQKESYGSAMVSYLLENRESKVLPVPGYKCKASGKVVINIEVDQQGKLTSFSLNEDKTLTDNECLRAEALAYAKKSTFFAKPDAPKKQAGTIEYLFKAQ